MKFTHIKSQKWVVFFILLSMTSSCISNKKLIYLQNTNNDTSLLDEATITYSPPKYRLQVNDIVDVNILTQEDFIKNGFKKEVTVQRNIGMGAGAGDILYFNGYTINDRGYINIPILGEIFALGKTIDELKVEIESKLREFVTASLFLDVKLGGIRYSTLGEFRNPGKFLVLQNQLTLFEALANAGDMTTIAKRNEVYLIRQYPDGSKIHKINLNERNIISSPFYFIQPNDVLYAEPMRVREVGSTENVVQTLGIFLTITSTLLFVFTIFNQ
jgi:polysaccharide biosynthesis/export protein